MNWMQTVRMAFKSILNNKVRSILTMLGIIIGVASVIAIVASIQGTSKLQRLQYEAMGVNRIDIYGYGAKNRDWQEFEDYMTNDLSDKIAAWSPQSQYYDWQNSGIQYRAKRLDNNDSNSGYTYMYFGNEHYGEVTSHALSAGRDISAADCRTRARVCVIGETLRKYFFGAMSPIGQKLQIGGKGFEVIGVYAGKYDGKLNTDDQMIVMPYTLQSTMMSVYGMADRQYIVKAAEKDVIAELTDELLPGFMQGRCEAGNGYFSASSDSQWQEQSESSNNMLALLGGGVAGISLLVGGIGIMNIMLVSVTERTREIGIRMAIGAQAGYYRAVSGRSLGGLVLRRCDRHCARLLSFGGAGQSAARKNAEQLHATVEQFTVLPSAGLVIGAFLFSALLGIIFGLYPANKASNLQPVDALRTQ